MTLRPFAAAALSLSLTSGCMTYDTRSDPTYDGPRLYSGTRVALRQAGGSLIRFDLVGLLLFGGDVPLSLLADTLLLPVTIGEEGERRRVLGEELRVDVEKDSVLGTAPSGSPADLARALFAACKERLEKHDPRLADCYGLETPVRFAEGDPRQLRGAEYKVVVRALLAEAQRRGEYYTWRDPVFANGDPPVRVDAVLWSGLRGRLGAISLRLGPGTDGQWRILGVDDAVLR